MDFIFDNIIWFVMAAAGIVQWWKSTQEAKQVEREQEGRQQERENYEEFIEEAESRIPNAAVPPPLPAGGGDPMPGVERSPVPDLRRRGKREVAEASPITEMNSELARQAALAEQISELKRAKKDSRPNFDIQKKKKTETSGGLGLKARLKNGQELKDAFVLKEILEKPVGLR
ncbi:MAG: hypothetical protein ACSHX9_14460 [Luteolibacter sp.]